MNLTIEYSCDQIDWKELTHVVETAGLAPHTPEMFQKAFENSFAVVFLRDGQRLIGCARALSDAVVQSALYDVALLPEYQGGRGSAEPCWRRCSGNCRTAIPSYTHPRGKRPFTSVSASAA